MSRAESRIEVGLSRLVEHIVPAYADDDEEAINERYDEAYSHAHEILDNFGESKVSPDAVHAADLIRKKRTTMGNYNGKAND